MVKRVYLLTIFKTIKSKFVRFLVNLLIVLLSIALTAALGFLPYGFKDSFLVNYEENTTPDIIIKLKDNNTRITNEVIDKIKLIDNVKEISSIFALDVKKIEGNDYNRVYIQDFENNTIAKPKLVNGKMPEDSSEILINVEVDKTTKHQIGEKIKLNVTGRESEYTIVGSVYSPLYLSTRPEVAWTDNADTDNPDYVDSIYYMDINKLPQMYKAFLPITDLYITMNNKSNYMTKEYDKEVEVLIASIKQETNNEYNYLSLNENTSYKMFSEYNDTIHTISIIFPSIFILVCALVTYIITEKLILDERKSIACEFSLGVPKRRIIGKYLCFSLISTFIGVVAGYFVGVYLLPRIFFKAYEVVYYMNGIPTKDVISPIGIYLGITLLLLSIIVTMASVIISLRETPASLMLNKAPKPGKKILLERVGFIWNRFSFSFKSSIRNIIRNKKNLILTSLSVIGSTVLILIGFALNDSAKAMVDDPTYKNVAVTMGSISAVIIVFGLAIGILVIYALASMNIDDREREIAVLKVLGYYDYEGALYTSRELLLITVFAAMLGIPIGALVVYLVFKAVKFASISDVNWYSYVLTYAITVLSSLISCLLLFPKIKKIDFNISLKSIE